jgi:hypothetical protein
MGIGDLLLCLSQIISGLGSRPHGRYADAKGTTSIDYGWWKVLVKLPREFAPFTVKVRLGKVILTTRAGEMAFTYNEKDDTFTGPNALRIAKVNCPVTPCDNAPHSAR